MSVFRIGIPKELRVVIKDGLVPNAVDFPFPDRQRIVLASRARRKLRDNRPVLIES